MCPRFGHFRWERIRFPLCLHYINSVQEKHNNKVQDVSWLHGAICKIILSKICYINMSKVLIGYRAMGREYYDVSNTTETSIVKNDNVCICACPPWAYRLIFHTPLSMEVKGPRSGDHGVQFCGPERPVHWPGKLWFSYCVGWSWRRTIWPFVAVVKVQGVQNNVQPLYVNSRHNKHACRIKIVSTSPTHSSATDENRTHVDTTSFAQNLRINLVKLFFFIYRMYSSHFQGHPNMTLYVRVYPALPPFNVFIKCFSKMHLRPGVFPTIFRF